MMRLNADTLTKAFATVGGAGYLPFAPGTWGAAVGAAFLLPLASLDSQIAFWVIFIISVLLTYLGALAANTLASQWGEDPKSVVIDEFVGVWVAILGHSLSMTNILWGFLLFRVFDIWKPLGIRKLENFPNGWGVMLDDVGAGIVANIFLYLLTKFIFA